MSLPTPAGVSEGLDHINATYRVDLSDVLLLSTDCGDPVPRWHRKAATVAVDIARALVAARRANDRISAEGGGLAAHPSALSELAVHAEALDWALQVAMAPHQPAEAADVA
jgi:hypothetical protein